MFKLNEKGQFFVEGILLMVVFTSIGLVATRAIRNNNLLGKMVEGPWGQVRAMIENGGWNNASPNDHPNMLARQVSFRGDNVR